MTHDLELKPCPFCGGRPRIDLNKVQCCSLHGEPSQSVRVYCYHTDCPSRPSVSAGDAYNCEEQQAREQAVTAWNTRAALSTPKVEAAEPVEPVAYLVHNFMVARQPVKAQGRFPSPDHYLYPASRKDDAEATAKTLRADCDPLYISPTPVPTITDEAVERAARALDPEIWEIDAPVPTRAATEDFHARRSRSIETARTVLTAAFPSRGEAE